MLSYLRYPLLIFLWVVTLMSGAFSLVREVYGFYSGALPPPTLFWMLVRISFILGAAILWGLEHSEKKALKSRVNHTSPRLILETTDYRPREWLQHQDALFFFLRNVGERAASFIEIEPIPSKSGRFSLRFVHPTVIDRGQRPPITFEVLEHVLPKPETSDTRFYVEMLREFFKDNPANLPMLGFDLKIRYRDNDGSEVTDEIKLQCDSPFTQLKVLPSARSRG